LRFDHFCFGVFVFGMLMFSVLAVVFVLRVFSMFVHEVLGITERSGVFGTFVRSIGFEFSAIRGAMLFDFFSFILGEFGFGSDLIFGGIQVRVLLAFFFFCFFVLGKFGFTGDVNFLGFVLFEFGATDKSIGFSLIRSFLVFCFGKLESEGSGLLFAQFDFAARAKGF
jgi:hypothetical protein